jgi:surface antigen
MATMPRSRNLSPAISIVAALAAAGCNSVGSGSTPPPSVAAAAAAGERSLPTGAALGGILGGPVGARLDEADRQAAYDAQVAALETGQRQTWRGAHGAYGYVEPTTTPDAQGCRGYSQTIYIGGRPQRGQGLGCRLPDGSWRMAI